MARIGNNENQLLEDAIAAALEIVAAGKRALYWTDDPEVASQVALMMAAAQRIRVAMINENSRRRDEAAQVNGKVS